MDPSLSPVSISPSASTSSPSQSYLVERTNTVNINRTDGPKLTEKSRQLTPATPAIVLISQPLRRNSDSLSLVPIICSTEPSTPIDDLPHATAPQPAANHPVHSANKIPAATDVSLPHLPPKLRRKQLAFVRQELKPVPSPVVTPNQVIWAPSGPSGWVNLINPNPSQAGHATSKLGAPPLGTRSRASVVPIPSAGSGSEPNLITTSRAQGDRSSTSSQPGICTLQRTSTLIQAHTLQPSKLQPVAPKKPTLAPNHVVYNKNDIAELKAALPCVPVNMRRMQEAFVRQQEFFSRSRASRARRVVQPACRSSLRIKALKGASATR